MLPIGRVPRLAICEAGQGTVSLHFCDGTWGNVASTEYETIEQAKIDAKLNDGVLRLELPKVEKARPRQITIRTE